MTISTATRKAGPYAGNDVASAFAFAFKVFANSDLVVTHADSAGVETTLVLDSGYSVALNADQNANPGGTVTYLAGAGVATALPSGESLTITSDVPQTQETNLANGGAWLPEVIENALDKLTIFFQELLGKVNRAVRQPISDSAAIGELPTKANRLGKYFAFDAVTGDPVASSGTADSGLLRDDLASVANAKGASLVAIEDAGAKYLASTTEGALQEIATAARTFASVALMKAATPRFDGEVVRVVSYNAAASPDGGEDEFYWSAASTATTYLGKVFALNAGGNGRWLSKNPKTMRATQFGAFLSGTAANNTTAINSAIAYAIANSIAVIELDEPGYLPVTVGGLVNADQVTFVGKGAFFDKRQATVVQISDNPASKPVKPSGLFTWLPFNVYGIMPDGTVLHDFNIDSYKPAVAVTYYIDPVNGNDANAGTSPEAALLTLTAAYGKADYDEIVLLAGELVHEASSISPTRSHILRSISGNPADTTIRFGYSRGWTLNSGAATYKTSSTLSSVTEVFDASFLSEDGDYKPLIHQASVAAVDAAPGSWYYDSGASLLYVHTHDGRAPDSLIKPMRGVGLTCSGLLTVWAEGIGFEGGNDGPVTLTNTSAANYVTLYAKNCMFKYSPNSAMTVQGCDVYMQGCDIAYAALDCLNYHALNSKICRVVEIDCRARYAGWKYWLAGVVGSESQNASSNHDDGETVRIGGEYHDCYGPIIADTGSGQKTWNVGVLAHHTQANVTATQKVNYYCEGAMYNDNCGSYGSTYDGRTNGGILYLHKFRNQEAFTHDVATGYARQY